MAQRFYKDKKGEIAKVAKWCIKKYFPDRFFHKAKIRYVFWEGEHKDKTGNIVRGEACIPSKRERDLYGVDFIIAISEDFWHNNNKTMKRLVVTHEHDHCVVRTKEDDGQERPQYDDFGRLKLGLKKHDININTFAADIERFGMTGDLIEAVATMNSLQKRKSGKKKKKKSGSVPVKVKKKKKKK